MTPAAHPEPLPWRDTPLQYGRLTRILHWGMGALILYQLLGVSLERLTGSDTLPTILVGYHAQVGTILFLLIVVRIIWALINRHDRPPHGAGWVGGAARMGHAALYALMFVVPALALLRAWGSPRVFAPFGFEVFSAKEPRIEWTSNLAGALHGELAWLMAALILGHVVMVGLHEGMWRDSTLSRMLGRSRA